MNESGPGETRDAGPSARAWFWVVFWAVQPLWWSPLVWWLAFSTRPVLGVAGRLLLGFDLLLVLVLLFALPTLFVTPPALLFRRTRRSALLYGAGALVFIPCFVVGEFYLGTAVRRHAVTRFVQRSAPLVRAIEAYQAERGRPPSALEDLVPAYLNEVPSTGFWLSPKYRYVEGKKSQQGYGENPWVLIASPPCHFMGFDLLLYFPRQNYPLLGYGGWLERFGSWAYVHE